MQIYTIAKVIGTILRDPRCLCRVINYEEEKEHYVSSKYSLPHGLPNIDLLDFIPEFKESIEPVSFLEGSSMVTDIALLRSLARRYPHCEYLEIGTWRGESVANMADLTANCTTISLSETEMRDIGLPEDFIKVHGFFSKELSNVNHIYHSSLNFDFSSLGRKFDIIFIDGDHSYDSVKSDTQNVFDLLKNDSSIVVWHDYGFSSERIRWSVLAAILDGCPKERRKDLYHISNTMCAVCIKGDFSTSYPGFPQVPNKKFKVGLSATKI